MKKLFLLCSIFAACACSYNSAMADDITVTLTDPATMSDTSQIPADNPIAFRSISRDCGGVVESVLTDQLTHIFTSAPAGTCNITASVLLADGRQGEPETFSLITGLVPDKPVIVVTGNSSSTLQDAIDFCNSQSPSCVVVLGQ